MLERFHQSQEGSVCGGDQVGRKDGRVAWGSDMAVGSKGKSHFEANGSVCCRRRGIWVLRQKEWHCQCVCSFGDGEPQVCVAELASWTA